MSQFVSLIFWNTAFAGLLGIFVFLAQRYGWLKSRPGLCHFLWLIVLVKLAAPPIFSLPIPAGFMDSRSATSSDASGLPVLLNPVVAAGAPAATEPTQRSWSWSHAIALVAAMGTFTMFLACLVRTQRIARLVRLANTAPDWLQDMVDALARDSGVLRQVTILTIDGCVSPFLWVTRSGPSIVMPSVLVERLTREELNLIVNHEIQHYARRDHWTNLLSMIVGAFLWWNPIAWWARRELRIAQELCCDASVLASDQRQRRRYAETLLQTIDFIASDEASIPVPTTAFGSCSTFKRRIEMIGEKNLVSGMPHMARLLLLPLGALLIAISPAHAHDDDQSESLANMRGQISELRAAVNDLQSTIMKLTNQDRRIERDNHDQRDSWLTRERMLQMAENARLNDEELVTLLQLGNSVDGNPRQFERLVYSDDLNEMQRHVLNKLTRDNDRHTEERSERSEGRIMRLNRETLNGMAERAELNEMQKEVLFQLAERVDFNARQFESLSHRDDLSDRQSQVLERLSRVRIDREFNMEDRREGKIVRLTREDLIRMAERADLNEDERGVLFRLAEKVDFNTRQIERLILSEDLNRAERRVMNKLFRDREHEDREHEDRDREREDRDREKEHENDEAHEGEDRDTEDHEEDHDEDHDEE